MLVVKLLRYINTLAYGTTQMQVDGLALKYLRTNTHLESVSVRHEHNTTVYAMSLNR